VKTPLVISCPKWIERRAFQKFAILTSLIWGLIAMAGCGPTTDKDLPPLHAVKGIVQNDGQHVSGGRVSLRALQDDPNLMINAVVGPDGKFELDTIYTREKRGPKHPGAPIGTYRLTYAASSADHADVPVELIRTFTVEPNANEWTVELSEK
jgi:hypothetical protein